MDKKKDFPTTRTEVVVGIHQLHSAQDVLQALAVAVPSLKPALDSLLRLHTSAIINYKQDVENLERELGLANEAEDALGAKLVEAEARFKLKCDEVERLHKESHQKNVGFVEAIQEKNRESAALEARLETAVRMIEVTQRHIAEAETYNDKLVKYITREHKKALPKKLFRYT